MAIKTGTEASDEISGTSSADTIHGKGGDDALFGLGGADRLYGGLGNDFLVGGAGKDTLTGGPGDDVFEYQAFSDSRGTTADLITDFLIRDSNTIDGGDRVDLVSLGTATHLPSYDPSFTGLQAVFTYNATTNVTTLSYYEGSSTPVFQLKFTGNVHYDKDNFDGIVPSPVPTETDDAVVGTANADTINLLGGDDTYRGFGGNDSVSGGSGRDQINGDFGNDNIRGGSGSDFLDGGNGDDILYGGTENDVVIGDSGKDSLYGGQGDDDLLGGDHDDFISGQLGDDRLVGSVGNDTLDGGDGYDTASVAVPDNFFSNFTITKNADGSVTLTDNVSSEGTDTLIDVEAIQFLDGTYIIATNTFIPEDSII